MRSWAAAVPTDGPARTLRLLRSVAWAGIAATVAAAGALALVRLGDPASRRVIELVTLTPLGLPLAAIGAVTALVLLGTSDRRRLPGIALVVALSLSGLHAWWLSPLYVGSASAAGQDTFVVMSLNFEVGDVRDLAGATRDHDVDLLVLLEVTPQHLDQLLATGIESWLPHAAAYAEGDLGTVVLSRVPVTGSRPLYEGADSQVVDLVDDGLGPVTLVAIHTRPPYIPDGWRADHEQTFAALSRIRDDKDTAVVLAGDFNATLAHAPIRRILGLGFRDAAAQANEGWSPTWPTGGHERRFGVAVPAFAAIDHVLTSPSLVVTRASTIDVAGADHRAVLATVAGVAG